MTVVGFAGIASSSAAGRGYALARASAAAAGPARAARRGGARPTRRPLPRAREARQHRAGVPIVEADAQVRRRRSRPGGDQAAVVRGEQHRAEQPEARAVVPLSSGVASGRRGAGTEPVVVGSRLAGARQDAAEVDVGLEGEGARGLGGQVRRRGDAQHLLEAPAAADLVVEPVEGAVGRVEVRDDAQSLGAAAFLGPQQRDGPAKARRTPAPSAPAPRPPGRPCAPPSRPRRPRPPPSSAIQAAGDDGGRRAVARRARRWRRGRRARSARRRRRRVRPKVVAHLGRRGVGGEVAHAVLDRAVAMARSAAAEHADALERADHPRRARGQRGREPGRVDGRRARSRTPRRGSRRRRPPRARTAARWSRGARTRGRRGARR